MKAYIEILSGSDVIDGFVRPGGFSGGGDEICRGTRLVLVGDKMTVGRGLSPDMTLPSRFLNVVQATFERTPEGWSIRDGSEERGPSTNGTFVNGIRLGERLVALKDGDSISFSNAVQATFRATKLPGSLPNE